MSFLHLFTPAATAGLLLIVPTFGPAPSALQSEAAKQQPPAKPAASSAESKPGETDQIELFEDRSLVVVGRVLRKEGQMFLRIKGLPGMNQAPGQKPRPAGDEKAGEGKNEQSRASGAVGAQEPAGAAAQKRKTGTRRTLQLNEDIQLLKSAMLEDLEEDVGLKELAGKTDVEATPLMQVQGVLTMYRGQPYLFVQTYRTRTELDSSRHDEKRDDKPDDKKN